MAGAYVTATRSAALDFNKDFSLSVWINLKSGIPPTSSPWWFFPQNLISNGSDATNVNLRVLSSIVEAGGQDSLWFNWHTAGQNEHIMAWLASDSRNVVADHRSPLWN